MFYQLSTGKSTGRSLLADGKGACSQSWLLLSWVVVDMPRKTRQWLLYPAVRQVARHKSKDSLVQQVDHLLANRPRPGRVSSKLCARGRRDTHQGSAPTPVQFSNVWSIINRSPTNMKSVNGPRSPW
jgi:hypothetical protein